MTVLSRRYTEWEYQGDRLLCGGHEMGYKGEVQGMVFGLGSWSVVCQYRELGHAPEEQGCCSTWGYNPGDQ